MPRKRKVHKRTSLGMLAFRSALTNGSSLFALKWLDQRSAFARRYRDLIANHVSDLGGAENVSHAERVLINRASMLICQLERFDCRFAEADGNASNEDLLTYQRVTNSVRRTLETLGLQRRPRDVTRLSDLLAQDHHHEAPQ
jgi:hypothetical protein